MSFLATIVVSVISLVYSMVWYLVYGMVYVVLYSIWCIVLCCAVTRNEGVGKHIGNPVKFEIQIQITGKVRGVV